MTRRAPGPTLKVQESLPSNAKGSGGRWWPRNPIVGAGIRDLSAPDRSDSVARVPSSRWRWAGSLPRWPKHRQGGRQGLWRVVLFMLIFSTIAGVLIHFALRQELGYDSYWHVFVANHNIWRASFWKEASYTAHPPLFFLALALVIRCGGPHLLTYQSISLISTILSAWLLFLVVRLATSNWTLGVLAGAAFGLSFNAVSLGTQVRSYALCVLFMLGACFCYFKWVKEPARNSARWAGWGVPTAMAAALLTHYSAFFFLAATMGATLLLCLIDRRWRKCTVLRLLARPWTTLLMFAGPVGVAVGAYIIHVSSWPMSRMVLIRQFLFDASTESPFAFLVRNTVNFAGLMLPAWRERELVAPAHWPATGLNWKEWLSMIVVGCVVAGSMASVRRSRPPRLISFLLLTFALMVGLNVVAGMAGRYPYGGHMRHEFFLFPFAVAGFFGCLELLRRGLGRRSLGQRSWAAVVGVAVVLSVASWIFHFSGTREKPRQEQMDRFEELFGSPGIMFVDRLTFFPFFARYHQWHWQEVSPAQGDRRNELWSVSVSEKTFEVCRAGTWQFDLSNLETYQSAAACLKHGGGKRLILLESEQPNPRAVRNGLQGSRLIHRLSRQVGLVPGVVEVARDGSVYVELEELRDPLGTSGVGPGIDAVGLPGHGSGVRFGCPLFQEGHTRGL